MRHAKKTFKVGRTGSHRRAMIANMLKSLIESGRVCTTLTKAKELRRHADRLITLAKKDTLASRRLVISKLRIVHNPLTQAEIKAAKGGDQKAYSRDRLVIDKLFTTMKGRFTDRQGGYTRIIKAGNRVGDNASTCYVEYL